MIATDPAPNAEANLRKYVDEAWKTLSKNGQSPRASRERLTFEPNVALALAGADFVQENAPERPDFKAKLFADMDDAAPAGAILASSSSSITMDVIQSQAKRPERCVIGHPFNPPHIIPLVEVAVSYGPGPRWGVMGPSLQWHLGGGQGGIQHFMDHLMDPLAGLMKALGNPDVTPELKQTVADGVLQMAGNRSVSNVLPKQTLKSQRGDVVK